MFQALVVGPDIGVIIDVGLLLAAGVGPRLVVGHAGRELGFDERVV